MGKAADAPQDPGKQQRNTMNNNLRLTTMALCVASIVLAGITPANAQLASGPDEGNPECRAALQDAHDRLVALKASGPLDAFEASTVVDDVAGTVCGFSILHGQFPLDTAGLAADIAAVSGSSGGDPPAFDAVNIDEPKVADVNTGRVVPCTKSGAGTGTITAYILGIVLDQQTAAGNWVGEGTVVHVTGTAGSVSGDQAKTVGNMFVAAVGPLPALDGDSGATCVETTTTTIVGEECVFLIFWWKCTKKVQTSVSLAVCGASATQDMAGLGLLVYRHSYEVEDNPCNAAPGGKASALNPEQGIVNLG